MKILIVAIGQRQPAWADEAVADLRKRFPPDFALTIRELKAEARTGGSGRARTAEVARLRAAVPPGSLTVALDERGRDLTSAEFAALLGAWRERGESPVFVLGGPDGLTDDFRRAAQLVLRLSSMTLPHALARLLLVEQLYRAWAILSRHPYHRA